MYNSARRKGSVRTVFTQPSWRPVNLVHIFRFPRLQAEFLEKMMKDIRARVACVGLLMLLGICASSSFAQTVTTGSLRGEVVDPQGAVLPAATVVAVHTPTGTTYETVTGADGRYQILNMRVGGPYTVTITMQGFRVRTVPDVIVALGEPGSPVTC
jgi:hypothetical protein